MRSVFLYSTVFGSLQVGQRGWISEAFVLVRYDFMGIYVRQINTRYSTYPT